MVSTLITGIETSNDYSTVSLAMLSSSFGLLVDNRNFDLLWYESICMETDGKCFYIYWNYQAFFFVLHYTTSINEF